MAITISNVTPFGQSSGGASEITQALTLSAGLDYLIVAIAFDDTVNQSFTAVEYNSVAMTQLTKSEGSGRSTYVYQLASPASGTNNFFGNWDFGSACACVAYGISGVASFGTPDIDSANTGSLTSCSPASSVGDTVLGFCSVNGAGTITDNQTNIDESVGYGVGISASQKVGEASSTTLTWSHSSTHHTGVAFSATPSATGLTIDSTDATMQRNTNFELVCSTPTTAPTTGNTTLTNGNDTLTPSSVTGSDPYTLTFPVGDLTKQVDATGYDWTLTVDAETDTTGNIPLAIQAGYTKVDLVSPVTTNASLLFGVSGDTPVTGDDLEYDVTSTLDSGVTLSVAASGVWTVTEATEGDWVTDITVSRRVVQVDGSIGTEAVVTLSAPTSATSGLTIVTDMVSNIVSNMVN